MNKHIYFYLIIKNKNVKFILFKLHFISLFLLLLLLLNSIKINCYNYKLPFKI